MTTFINLTPHALNIITPTGTVSVPPSGEIARVSSTSEEVLQISEIPVYETSYGEVTGLPEPVEGSVFLVSGLVLSALEGSGRMDVMAPGELVRNEAGQPVGCKGLRRNSK